MITAVYGGNADFAGMTSAGYGQSLRGSSGAVTYAQSGDLNGSVPTAVQETVYTSTGGAAVPQELSVLNVDQLFSSTATTRNTPRMLAGALGKAQFWRRLADRAVLTGQGGGGLW